MALDENSFRVALDAYYGDTGSIEDGIRKAIEAYLAEMFKPGQVMTMEPLEAIPQRDHRKELWIDVAISVARSGATTSIVDPAIWANRTLAEFDKPSHRSPPMDEFSIGLVVGLFAGAFIGVCIAALLVVSKGEST